jgi:hypothetical protein
MARRYSRGLTQKGRSRRAPRFLMYLLRRTDLRREKRLSPTLRERREGWGTRRRPRDDTQGTAKVSRASEGGGMNPKSAEQQRRGTTKARNNKGAEGFLTAFGMTVRGRATAGDMEPSLGHPQRRGNGCRAEGPGATFKLKLLRYCLRQRGSWRVRESTSGVYSAHSFGRKS